MEEAQKQWLSTNQVLSFELDKALQVNQLLCVEIRRLKGLLEEERIGHNVNVAEETPAQVSGVVSTTVEGANDDTY